MIAEGIVELAATSPDLGPPIVPDAAVTPYPFPVNKCFYGHSQSDIYGRLLLHGPVFQTMATVEACDRNAVRATVRETNLVHHLPEGRSGGLVLPVSLIDASGQIGTSAIVEDWTEEEVHLTFPNQLHRVEFVHREPSIAPSHCGPRPLCSPEPGLASVLDLEMMTTDGRVILRILGRSEQLVRVCRAIFTGIGRHRVLRSP